MNESQRSGVTYPQLVRNEISDDGDGPQPHFFSIFQLIPLNNPPPVTPYSGSYYYYYYYY